MFAELPFFLLLLGISGLFVIYKVIARHFPWIMMGWWSYRLTLLGLGLAAWLFVYQDGWPYALGLFVYDYIIFYFTVHGRIRRWLGVTLALLPLLLVKTYILHFITIIGLSFITFRSIDALLMYRIEDATDAGEYFLYLFFPPAIITGPMYRWRNFREDLGSAYANLSLSGVLDGWERFALGIVQKFALAQIVDICVLQRVSPQDYTLSGVLSNAFGYALFLYFDFAGYSNMAIGAAALFGFHLPENFKNPIATSNPQDFWRRWHVSLSEWLRDVVFSPLYKHLVSKGGMGKHRLQAQNICIFATLMIMGTWNGFEPQYLCSGLLFGVYSVVYNDMVILARGRPRLQELMESRVVGFAGRIISLLLVVFALYVFSGRSPLE